MTVTLISDDLFTRLETCLCRDRRALRKRLKGLQGRLAANKPFERGLATLQQAIASSQHAYQQRLACLPVPEYPEELPVSGKRASIAAAIAAHQVVIVAGETGSGKTTQLPKICLELGRGVAGMIGHTQPRRIAARSVATRIAEELHTELGQLVGYKVRFTERASEGTLVRLMTDGILLAEIQSDPLLERYDTLIIDEAHERSLNIDFLLGYLREILPRRPELKLIITSATINTDRFAEFFHGAPVIEVSGRGYPVEVRYRPLLDEDRQEADPQQALLDAVDELGRVDPLGDILIFLAGERDIREAADALSRHRMRETEVIPLFSRLSAVEQDRVFRPHRGRRIVLATNVAETSLTVPGIRFVIDTGLARISRYSHRTKVQRLPIEAISQASANQRAGRCGRLSAGVCIRLYDEADFAARPAFTDPEIRRTNLASVILQMKSMGLGEIGEFPFIDPPERRYIQDGLRLLHELNALDADETLTEIGRKLARLPLDPRLGRMLLAAEHEGSLHELLIIVSALSVQDPRDRPQEAQQAADQSHARFRHERSDFMAWLALWQHYHEQARHLSQNKLRKLCRQEFLSWLRMREWHDIHGQLLSQVRELGLRPNTEEASYEAIHKALLAGLLGHIALRDEPLPIKANESKDKGAKRPRRPVISYLGARNLRLQIHPASGQARRGPKWMMAAELVETRQLFAREVAAIEPEWVEALAGHLLKRQYLEPHWEKRRAQVVAFEQVSLYGLVLVARRKVNYGPIDPPLARELFIRHALVEGEYQTRAAFFAHNRALLDEVALLEAKSRRRDQLIDEQALFDFYDQRLPTQIISGRHFERWLRSQEDPRLLYFRREELLQGDGLSAQAFPDHWHWQGLALPLRYHFAPAEADDGVTLELPLALLAQLSPEPFEWLVPGLLEEKLIALIKAMPKAMRRNYVPAVNFAAAALEALRAGRQIGEGSLRAAFARQLHRISGVAVPDEAWDEMALPTHLRMNFRVLDESGKAIAEGRDLPALQTQMRQEVRASLRSETAPDSERHPLEQQGLDEWQPDQLPEMVSVERHGLQVSAWPAFCDEGDAGVALRLFESAEAANAAHYHGLVRLFMLGQRDKLKYLRKQLPAIQALCLHYLPLGPCEGLKDEILLVAARRALALDMHTLPRERSAYTVLVDAARERLIEEGIQLCEQLGQVMAAHARLRKQLKGRVQPNWLPSISDMQQQLDSLIWPGFVSATPLTQLPHLPRYLRALERRLEKLPLDPLRDQALLREMQGLWQGFWSRYDEKGLAEAAGQPLRWQLEELRVSLFAQELGTVEKVSVARLEKQRRS